ncbi:MAG: YSC84-related protein [Halioglobus sp.]|nr:YSC84-related protein [Halioglobus sp.]
MHTLIKSTLLFLLVSLTSQVTWADEFDAAIKSFEEAGQSGAYFDSSYGYAVFPTIGKGGIGIGGAHGSGRVYKQGELIGTSSMTQITIGFQLGGEAFSQIIFFENESALTDFTSGNFEFSADASAVAITAGASATANTGGGVSGGVSGGKNNASTKSLGYRKGMAIFTIAKGGLMYQATVGGQKYSYDPM